VPAVRIGPIVGLIVQVVLLAALAAGVGLGPAGWAVGIACGVVTNATLTWGLHRAGMSALGPANRVTLTRATLVGAVAALAADSLHRPAPLGVLVTLVAVALALDGVDGQVARRTGSVSALGARFDMETDSLLVLVLSVYVAHPLAPWAVTIGAMRYAFVAAAWLLPWMRADLPPRFWRKVVAATQGVVLVVATADVLPRVVMVAALAGSLLLLVESFGRDVLWLWRHRAERAAPRRTEALRLRIRLGPVAARSARGAREAAGR
jgi:phosphatidylglycerophosphate synthase